SGEGGIGRVEGFTGDVRGVTSPAGSGRYPAPSLPIPGWGRLSAPGPVDTGSMTGKTQLGTFLQARRSQLRPEDVGMPTYGERRRVPGLRREELALLAGVSASYYTRLEQGQSLSASAEVLDAIAGALRLDESERRHLHDLASTDRRRPRDRRPAPERGTEAAAPPLAVLGHVPAVVLGRGTARPARNRAGRA